MIAMNIEDKSKQTYTWSGTFGSRVGGILTTNNTIFEVAKWSPGISYDSSKGESIIAEFSPPVGHTITFSNSGSVSILMSLMALNLKTNDEVVLPNRSWISTLHAVKLLKSRYCSC